MIIEPKIKGFICISAHPKGCEKNVADSVGYLEKNERIAIPPVKTALVVGASAGYGLASAMTASFALGADVIGVAFEKNAQKDRNRTATAGMYNLAAYKKEAAKKNLRLEIIIGDAFSDAVKEKTCETAKTSGNKIDMLIYSVAAPSRTDPATGARYSSVLKPQGNAYVSKGIDLANYKLNETSIQPATEEEIGETVKVMGGEDLALWVGILTKNNLLSENAVVLSYSYIGPPVTHDIYLNGSVGAAKKHLKETSDNLNKLYKIKSYVSINKALVTQSSAAIPVLPLYISILFKVMKEKNLHENCIRQIYRLFAKLRDGGDITDENGYIRLDDWEMRADVQTEVAARWDKINDGNLRELADIEGFRDDFLNLFGFGLEGVDYGGDVEPEVDANSLGMVFV